ncbi:hypothetical protein [Rhizobium sp. RCC_161_2]|uniref:hypothetical protein n=1 Tax=Rhizobium sp. RCC_161_2 TaxID=3239219 RepID=UPI003524ADA3
MLIGLMSFLDDLLHLRFLFDGDIGVCSRVAAGVALRSLRGTLLKAGFVGRATLLAGVLRRLGLIRTALLACR